MNARRSRPSRVGALLVVALAVSMPVGLQAQSNRTAAPEENERETLRETIGRLEGRIAQLERELARARASASSDAGSVELSNLLDELRALLERARVLDAPPQEDGYELSFTGRVHAQFNAATVPDGEVGSEFMLRRARITAELEINDLVSGRIQPDFGGGELSLKDAYVRLSFSPSARVTIGQFKRPFDLFELTSSTQTLVIERAGAIRGISTCAGVGGVCSFSRFTEKLGYSDRDIGVQLDGSVGGSDWSYRLAVTNGEGADNAESNSAKSVYGRVEYELADALGVAANVGFVDYENDIDPTRSHGTAIGGDVEWGTYTSGWHVKAGVVRGDNWKNLAQDGTPSTFRAAQAIVTHKFPVASTSRLSAIEPLFRLSWADPDTDLDRDHEYFATTGLVFHFIGRNKMAANLEMWDPAIGSREWAFRVQSYLHF